MGERLRFIKKELRQGYCTYPLVTTSAQNYPKTMTTIIPIRASEDPESSGEVEWVMLELNGELLKPLDEPRRIPQANLLPDCTAVDDVRRRVELGSLKFDADVSAICV